MATSVGAELDKVRVAFSGYMDVTVQKEMTNTVAFADVVLGGNVAFLQAMSATALLNLESRLEELHGIYEDIPVLDVTEHWTLDKSRGCFVSEVRSSYRMKKVPRALVLSPATVEHPAQVQAFQEEIPAYKMEKTVFSGVMTPADKQACLERIAELTAAVRQARQRANDTPIKSVSVADKIFDYINGV